MKKKRQKYPGKKKSGFRKRGEKPLPFTKRGTFLGKISETHGEKEVFW